MEKKPVKKSKRNYVTREMYIKKFNKATKVVNELLEEQSEKDAKIMNLRSKVHNLSTTLECLTEDRSNIQDELDAVNLSVKTFNNLSLWGKLSKVLSAEDI